MAALHYDQEQRFTCQQCGRCCRRGWDIALTAGEVAAYRKADAGRLFRETEDGADGATRDPFEPIAGHTGAMRIRKRADGACGFLSADNRCRIHEALGAAKKPLTCRLFPFRFHPGDGQPLLTASFCCPTVVANEGASLAAQTSDLLALRKEWNREHAEPAAATYLFVAGRPMAGTSLGTLRRTLRALLDRVGPDGRRDLRANAARMAALLDDLTRRRALRLEDPAFTEYLELVARHSAESQKAIARQRPSALARIYLRGLLFVTLAARLQLVERRSWGLRLRLFALLLHCHGLWPAVSACDLGAARRARLDLSDPALAAIAWNYLRAQLETLGQGRRSVVDELAIAIGHLNVASLLAALRAGRAGRSDVNAEDLCEAVMEAVDLAHADVSGWLGGILATLAAGSQSLWILAEPSASR